MVTNTIRTLLAGAVALALLQSTGSAQFSLTPKTSFGGDGWLAPLEDDDLTTDNTQRGMSYNPLTNNVYVVDRNGGTTVKIYDGTTGADLGDLDVTGVSGGVFLLNAIDVAEDGAIYAANLRTDTDAASFKIYRWANEAATPTVAYDGVPTNGADIRLGDTLTVIGSGASTQIAAGANDAGGQSTDPGDNAFALFTTNDGVNFTGAVQDFMGTEPPVGAMRLGIDFVDADTVIGRGNGPAEGIVADFGAGIATQVASAELDGSALRPVAVDRVNDLLATIDTNSSAVWLYDIADIDNPVSLGSFTTLTGPSNANVNGVGGIEFGNGMLYALNTNNGIQAFNVVPEPCTGLLACFALLALRRLRN